MFFKMLAIIRIPAQTFVNYMKFMIFFQFRSTNNLQIGCEKQKKTI